MLVEAKNEISLLKIAKNDKFNEERVNNTNIIG